MKYIKGLFNLYINSSIHVAVAVYALTWITLLEFDLNYDETSLYFVFYATIVAYNFVKYFGLVKYHHRQFAQSLKWIKLISIIALLALCYYTLELKTSALLLLLLVSLITFFYAIPFIPRRLLVDEQRNLRQISGLKIYVIATVWALTTVLFPLLQNSYEVDYHVLLALVQRFLYVIVLMLPFEIRDLKFDSLKLATVPQKIGINSTKLMGSALLLLVVLIGYFNTNGGSVFFVVVALNAIITFLFLLFSNRNQSKYYSAFWVESLPILWLLSLLIFV